MNTTQKAIVVTVIPTYKPEASLLARLDETARLVDHVVVVDDGSGAEFASLLDSAQQLAHVVRLPHNVGIAAALNAGITSASSLGATHVLTLDQDSSLKGAYVQSALDTFRALEADGKKVASVGAGVIDGIPPGGTFVTPDVILVTESLQSGALYRASLFAEIGAFDDALVIDCVDTEFSLRASSRGFGTYLSRLCAIEHRLGEPMTRQSRDGSTYTFSHHSASRRYYMTRNRLSLLFRYGLRNPSWALHKTVDEARELFLSLKTEPDRRRQVTAVGFGIVDALLGRKGALSRGRQARLQDARS